MNERIKDINRYYKALEYESNKEEALKKISTLRKELKFKDTNDFSNRFLQAASIIEKNISIFKSACNHVDVVTTILNFLRTINVGLMFDNQSCTIEEMKIVYFMSITCEDHEISSFLEAALIDNSRMKYVKDFYIKLFSSYVFDMIVLEDSDLYAVISYLKITPFLLLKLRKILVQESIKDKFLWLIEKNFKNLYTGFELPIFVFHTKKELKINFESFDCMSFMSIWSENIITAKIIAAASHRDITYINAHLEFSSDIKFTSKIKCSSFNLAKLSHFLLFDKPRDTINPNELDKHSVYNLFYDGMWQKPVKNTYWIHNGNTYAYATTEDMSKCLKSAEKAMPSWSTRSIDFKREIINNLASTLECNGKFKLADVIKNVKLPNVSNILVCEDERLELARIHGPKGVVSIMHENENLLFSYLIYSLFLGNCAIVLYNGKNSCIAHYCNMFATAEIPPGVINFLSNKDLFHSGFTFNGIYSAIDLNMYCTSMNNVILCLK